MGGLGAGIEGTDDLAETELRSPGARYVETAGILPVCAVDGLRLMACA